MLTQSPEARQNGSGGKVRGEKWRLDAAWRGSGASDGGQDIVEVTRGEDGGSAQLRWRDARTFCKSLLDGMVCCSGGEGA